MEKDNHKFIHNHFETGSQPQIIQGHISGAIFAMSGAIVNQYTTSPPDQPTEEPAVVEPTPDVSPTDEVLQQLTPIFYGDSQEAAHFLRAIKGAKGMQVTDLVNQLVKANKISALSCHRDLWRVLNGHGLYRASESNWNQQVR